MSGKGGMEGRRRASSRTLGAAEGVRKGSGGTDTPDPPVGLPVLQGGSHGGSHREKFEVVHSAAPSWAMRPDGVSKNDAR